MVSYFQAAAYVFFAMVNIAILSYYAIVFALEDKNDSITIYDCVRKALVQSILALVGIYTFLATACVGELGSVQHVSQGNPRRRTSLLKTYKEIHGSLEHNHGFGELFC